jgi:hypothetical protein
MQGDLISVLAGIAGTIIFLLVLAMVILIILLVLHGKQAGWGGGIVSSIKRRVASMMFFGIGVGISLTIALIAIMKFNDPAAAGADWQGLAFFGILLASLVIVVWYIAQKYGGKGKIYWTERGATWG